MPRANLGTAAKAWAQVKGTMCELFRTEILFLGHRMSQESITTDPRKVAKMLQFPRSRNE